MIFLNLNKVKVYNLIHDGSQSSVPCITYSETFLKGPVKDTTFSLSYKESFLRSH